jgi:hypothetical protein
MAQRHYEPEEVGRLANDLYDKRLRAQVETEGNIGKIIVIDVETGNYEIDADGLVAGSRIREKHPELNPRALFAIRIGFNAVFAIGGAVTRTAPR